MPSFAAILTPPRPAQTIPATSSPLDADGTGALRVDEDASLQEVDGTGHQDRTRHEDKTTPGFADIFVGALRSLVESAAPGQPIGLEGSRTDQTLDDDRSRVAQARPQEGTIVKHQTDAAPLAPTARFLRGHSDSTRIASTEEAQLLQEAGLLNPGVDANVESFAKVATPSLTKANLARLEAHVAVDAHGLETSQPTRPQTSADANLLSRSPAPKELPVASSGVPNSSQTFSDSGNPRANSTQTADVRLAALNERVSPAAIDNKSIVTEPVENSTRDTASVLNAEYDSNDRARPVAAATPKSEHQCPGELELTHRRGVSDDSHTSKILPPEKWSSAAVDAVRQAAGKGHGENGHEIPSPDQSHGFSTDSKQSIDLVTSSVPPRPRSTIGTMDAVKLDSGVMIEHMAGRIVDQARIVTGPGETRLELELDPPELGRVSVRLSETTGGISARVMVAHEHVWRSVGQSLADFQATLAEAGIELQDFSLAHRDAQTSDEFYDRSNPSRQPKQDVQPETSALAPQTATRTGSAQVVDVRV